MSHGTAREYRIEQLAEDGRMLEGFADRLASLINDLRLTAREMQSETTSDALLSLADALSDAGHDSWPGVTAAHEGACDAEDKEPFYADGPELSLALRLPIATPLAGAALSAAMAALAEKFGDGDGSGPDGWASMNSSS